MGLLIWLLDRPATSALLLFKVRLSFRLVQPHPTIVLAHGTRTSLGRFQSQRSVGDNETLPDNVSPTLPSQTAARFF